MTSINMLVPNNVRACWYQAIHRVLIGSNHSRPDVQDLHLSLYLLEHCQIGRHLVAEGTYYRERQ